MKQRMQGVAIGVLTTVLLLGAVTVYAATTRIIEVTVGTVRTTIFGQEFVVRDAQGIVIEPFVYEGIAFVPVNTVLHAMGANAQWNEQTNVLNFGVVDAERPPTATVSNFLQQVPPFDVSHRQNTAGDLFHNSGDVRIRDNVPLGGVFYDDALVFRRGNSGDRLHSLHNLSGRYSVVSGYVGRVDGANQTTGAGRPMLGIFNFYADGRRIHQVEVSPTDLPQPFLINVAGVDGLKIEFIPSAWGRTTWALVNATIR